MLFISLFFFKQKTAYEMRISDWSSDVCSSDLGIETALPLQFGAGPGNEFVDIAVIVGEQYVALHMFRRSAGIMFEARQREVGAQAVEQRQRPFAQIGRAHV